MICLEKEYSLKILLEAQGWLSLVDWVNVCYPKCFHLKQQVYRFKNVGKINSCYRQTQNIVDNFTTVSFDYKERIKKVTSIVNFDEFLLPIVYTESIEQSLGKLPEPPDFTTGNYCPYYGQSRHIWHEPCSNLRIAIGKMYSFNGTYNASSKTRLCYYIEFESESCNSSEQFVQQILKWLNSDKHLLTQLYNSENKICTDARFRIYELYNLYPRQFVHENKHLKCYKQYWICPKFDGHKMIGILHHNKLQLFNQMFGIKNFTIPHEFTQRLIIQAEYFQSSNSYIITEVVALSINNYNDTFICNSLRHVCNDYNPTTWCTVSPTSSIKWIKYVTDTLPFLKIYFTHHILQFEFQNLFNNQWRELPIDGWLAVTTCGKYFKLKQYPTIELAIVSLSVPIIFKDAQSNLYTNIELTQGQISLITEESQTGIVEFKIVDINNFIFKAVRNDKTYPDSSEKVQCLLHHHEWVAKK